MAIELHHLQPSHDDELSRLKARIAELERIDTEHTVQIAKMNEYINHLEEERRWRKFPDEKPSWGKDVIVANDESKQFIVSFSYDMKWISFGNMHTCESKYVKYWMPLPSAPKEEK